MTDNLEQSIIQEISAFFGVPPFRIDTQTDIQGYFGADEVDFKELIWMMEEKYEVKIEHQDLQNIEKLVRAVQHYRLQSKHSKHTGGNNMSKALTNKKAVVTGASTGIGREISLLLAKEGAEVALVGRRIDELEKTKDAVTQNGGTASVFAADLQSETTKVAETILKAYETVDIIVNAAGVWHDAEKAYYGPRLWELSEEQIHEVIRVGVVAPMLLTRALIPPMLTKKYGKIINISGTFENGAKGWLHYYVSKKAIEEFTVGLSQELREYKIQVNAVSPSDTYTEAYARFYPNESPDVCMDPKDIARLVLALSMDDFDFITGQTIIARNKNA